MRDLYEYTMSEAIGFIAETVAEEKGVSKTLAKKLVVNALLYNCVVDEILGQVNFLLDGDE